MSRSLLKLDHEKLYYSISEVCRMTGLEAHVLRYWESEFPQMRPKKNRAGNRAYRMKEIQTIHYLRFLLHEEKFTIQGAKKKMSEVSPEEILGQVSLLRPYMLEKAAIKKEVPAEPLPLTLEPNQHREELEKIRVDLLDVLDLLDGDGRSKE